MKNSLLTNNTAFRNILIGLLCLILMLSCIVFTGCHNHFDGSFTTEGDKTTLTPTSTPDKTENTQDYLLTEGGDGSVSMVWNDQNGRVIKHIRYSAADNTTSVNFYTYDQYGCVCTDTFHQGNGNLIDDFQVDDFSQANTSNHSDYTMFVPASVDIDQAFTATIPELATLYTKAQAIYENYGVALLIADKVSAETGNAELCYDYNMIAPCIDLVDWVLSAYPQDFFRKFSDMTVNRTLCIQLVGTGDTSGVYWGGGETLIIQIDVNCYDPDFIDNSFFIYTLHHEIGHAINDRLFVRSTASRCPLTEDNWSNLNPDGFEYAGQADSNDLYLSGNNYLYFVDSYGCTNSEEDRATIFGEAMKYYSLSQDISYGLSPEIESKLRYLSSCIKAGFLYDQDSKLSWDHILDVE